MSALTKKGDRQRSPLPSFAYDEHRGVLVSLPVPDEVQTNPLTSPMGTDNPVVAQALSGLAVGSCLQVKAGCEDSAAAILSIIADAQPGDAVEGMLLTQMTACHVHASQALAKATRATLPAESELWSGIAMKFLQTFTRQVEALARYRRKGQQKMVIEHVTVSAGGQAVIGEIHGSGVGVGRP